MSVASQETPEGTEALRMELEKARMDLEKEKESHRLYVVTQKERDESVERRIEGYESQIAMLNEEIEEQSNEIERLSGGEMAA